MSAIKTSVPTGTWVADKAHSRVEFAIKHMGIATVRGSFGQFAGARESKLAVFFETLLDDRDEGGRSIFPNLGNRRRCFGCDLI